MKKLLIIFCDGGSRNNPGKSAGASVFYSLDFNFVDKGEKDQILELIKEKESIFETRKFYGIKTNNEAEYLAVKDACNFISENKLNNFDEIIFFLDSNLVVNQIAGGWKINNTNLKEINTDIKKLLSNKNYHFFHIYRQNNKKADALVNKVLDEN
jgi:ribonuclease HI